MDLALNNLQRLIHHKTNQPTNQPRLFKLNFSPFPPLCKISMLSGNFLADGTCENCRETSFSASGSPITRKKCARNINNFSCFN